MPIYQVTTKLLGTILVEAEMQGDVFETINKDQITNLVTYLHKEDTSKKNITLESELTELLETNSITLWSTDNFFCGEYGGLVYTAESIIGVFDKMLKKNIARTPENLEISDLIRYQLKKPHSGFMTFSIKNDHFEVTSRDIKVVSPTLVGALDSLKNTLIKYGE